MQKQFTIFSFVLLSFSHLLFAQAPALEVKTYDQLIKAIRETRVSSQARIERAVNAEKVREAWETGKLIQEHILLNKDRAQYGEAVIKRLSADLETSYTELKYMLEFARAYPIGPAPDQLSWAHYRELLSVNDANEREAIIKEASAKKWSQKELRNEIKKRRILATKPSKDELTEAKPGKLNTYRIVKAAHGIYKNKLVVDLGFSSYFKPGEDLKLTEKDIVAMKQEDSTFTLIQNPELTEADLWTYQAHVIEVIDGDTIHASIDLGFGFTMKQTLRLRGLDAPEIKSSDGREAKEFLTKQLAKNKGVILLKTMKSDKYDRYLADIWVGKKYMNQELLNKGLAVKVYE